MVTNRTHKWWMIGTRGMNFPVRIACFLRKTVIFEIDVRFKFTQLYLSFGKSDFGDIMMVTILWNWSTTSNSPMIRDKGDLKTWYRSRFEIKQGNSDSLQASGWKKQGIQPSRVIHRLSISLKQALSLCSIYIVIILKY